MTNLFIVATMALALIGGEGHFLGAPVGGSTGIGSGLGHQGTGPGWGNSTSQSPEPLPYSVPPGGYGHAPPTLAPPSMQPSPFLH
jgi:hypothetical protein